MQSIIQFLTFIFTTIVTSVNAVFVHSQRGTVTRSFTAQEANTLNGTNGQWSDAFPNSIFTHKDGTYQVLINSPLVFTYNNVKIGNGSVANVTVVNGAVVSVSLVETSSVTLSQIQNAQAAATQAAVQQSNAHSDANDAVTLASANAHSDANDAAILANAKGFATAQAAAALTDANAHSDANDAATIAASKTYTDTKVTTAQAAAVAAANAHSDANDLLTLKDARSYADSVGQVAQQNAAAYTDGQVLTTLATAKAFATAQAAAAQAAAASDADTKANKALTDANTYTDSKIQAERQLAQLGIKDRRRVELQKGVAASTIPAIANLIDGTVCIEVGVNDANGQVFDTEMDIQVTDLSNTSIIVKASTNDALIFEKASDGSLKFVRKLDDRLMEVYNKLKGQIDGKVGYDEFATALSTVYDYIKTNLVFASPNS